MEEPGSSVHGILQARILELLAFPFSRQSSRPRDWTQVSCIVGRFCTSWATREALTFSKDVQQILFDGFVVVVQLLNHVWIFETPWTVAHQASLSFTVSQSLLKLMSIDLVMPSNHLILCHPFLLLPSIFPSIRVFFKRVGPSHQVAKVLELQLQLQSFQWIFGVDFL